MKKTIIPLSALLFLGIAAAVYGDFGGTFSAMNRDVALHQAVGVDHVVSAAYRIHINTTSCKLVGDANVGAVVFPANLVRLAIIPLDGTTAAIYWDANTAASTAGPAWPAVGLAGVPMTKATADTIRIMADANCEATVWVETPRPAN